MSNSFSQQQNFKKTQNFGESSSKYSRSSLDPNKKLSPPVAEKGDFKSKRKDEGKNSYTSSYCSWNKAGYPKEVNWNLKEKNHFEKVAYSKNKCSEFAPNNTNIKQKQQQRNSNSNNLAAGATVFEKSNNKIDNNEKRFSTWSNQPAMYENVPFKNKKDSSSSYSIKNPNDNQNNFKSKTNSKLQICQKCYKRVVSGADGIWKKDDCRCLPLPPTNTRGNINNTFGWKNNGSSLLSSAELQTKERRQDFNFKATSQSPFEVTQKEAQMSSMPLPSSSSSSSEPVNKTDCFSCAIF